MVTSSTFCYVICPYSLLNRGVNTNLNISLWTFCLLLFFWLSTIRRSFVGDVVVTILHVPVSPPEIFLSNIWNIFQQQFNILDYFRLSSSAPVDHLFRSSWLACFFLSRNIICSGITLNAQHCPGIRLLEWQLLAKLDCSKQNKEKDPKTEEEVEN